MKRENRIWVMVVTLVMAVILAVPCLAELTGTVTPGHVFAPNERPTTATLNAAANPTIAISGTVDGTTGLSAGSVNGAHLSDTIIASSNLVFNADSPRAISFANNGVSVAQISTAIAGNGLSGGGGTNLNINTAGNSLSATGDVLRITCAVAGFISGDASGFATNYGIGTGLAIQSGFLRVTNNAFGSFEYALASGAVFNTNHNLGAAPVIARFVLVCKTADEGYAVEDEVEATSFFSTAERPAFSIGVNSTNVFMTQQTESTIRVRNKSTGDVAAITQSRWRAKAYLRP